MFQFLPQIWCNCVENVKSLQLMAHQIRMANLHHALFPFAVDSLHPLFDNRKHKRSILVRLFLGPVELLVEPTYRPYEQVVRQIVRLTMQQRLHRAYLLDVAKYVPNLKKKIN